MTWRAVVASLGLLGCSARSPAPPVARAPAMYLVLVDRFSNGDPGNDVGIDLSDPQAFHGGDLAGIEARLDHLVDLGVTQIWLTPVMSMRTEKLDRWGAYHGYWVQDPTVVEPRFGGEPALLALRRATRERGLGLWLDVVWNHVSFDAPLRTEKPTWFHSSRPIVDWDDPVQRETHEVHGLPDLAQENPEVRAWLTRTTADLVRTFQPDGLRVDAVRHMPAAEIARIAGDLRAERPDLRLLGEVFDGDPTVLAQTWKATALDHVFDFPLRYALLDVVCRGRPAGRLGSILSQDHQYPDSTKLYTFLDNHDTERLATACGGDLDRAGLAIDVLTALRGVPVITWGTEVGLQGAGEPENRGDMRFGVDHPLGERIRLALARRSARPEVAGGRTHLLAVDDRALAWAQVRGERAATVVANFDDRPWTWRGRAWAPGVTVEAGTVPEPGGWAEVDVAADGGVVVGAGPALGRWDPAAGVPVVEGRARLRVPGGSVLAYKVVRRSEDGWIWPETDDVYLWVPPADPRAAAPPPR